MQKKQLNKPKLIVIVGPTAVGKSALAVRLAKRFQGEIVSADSRQVYRGLSIGTGKITRREMQGVPHHLLDVASPRRQYSVARYVKDARRAIAAIARRDKLPIIVGGTGFYIDALLGKVAVPDVPPNLKLRRALAKKTPSVLFALLQKLDPVRAKTIDRHNPRRLIRTIELAKNSTSRHSDILKNVRMFYGQYQPLFIGLTLPRELLRRRINARLKMRLEHGMLTEVTHLHKSGVSWKRLDALGLEYRYLSQYSRNEMPKGKMIEKLQTEIWRYAKRQMTWFKRNQKIHWFKPNQTAKIEHQVKNS